MNTSTRVLLVLLRLAIGWHFFIEGIDKIRSVDLVGETLTNRPWTSRAYLREAAGPVGDYFQRLGGAPDEEALALLTPEPVPEGRDPARVPPRQRIPPALDEAWNAYFERFVARYHLTDQQRTLAQARLDQAKDQAVNWMLGDRGLRDVREVEKSFGPSATVRVRESSRQRIEAYRNKVQELRQIMQEELPAFGHDVEKRKLQALKADLNRMRTELLAELEEPMQQSLNTVLSDDQKKQGAMPLEETPSAGLDLRHLLTRVGLNRNWETVRAWGRVQWIDALTRYGLTLVGLCLLLGLLTRTACLGGAAFLLLFYLALPALPWLPESPRAEGHYLYVNKNLIELLALLALATTASGRWFGLDGLLYVLAPWRWRTRPVAVPLAPESR